METDSPRFWTDELIARFRDYCFPKYDNPSCQFDIFEKMFRMSIEDGQGDTQHPQKRLDITYSCHTFHRLLEGIPFYLQLSTEANHYKESNIGYLQIVNGQNIHGEPQAKILACLRQTLELESRFDKAISDADRPPGIGKLITLRLDPHHRDGWNTTDSVGTKLPIRELEIEYSQGQAKEKWPTR